MSFSRARGRSRGGGHFFGTEGGFAPYVSSAERRRQAAAASARAAQRGQAWSPVLPIAGRSVATTFWGRAWCTHLEHYSDYANRLPRGRSYVRNGSVVHLEILPGQIRARVQGSSLYEESITIERLAPGRWAELKARCAGQIGSLLGLLEGRLSDSVMRLITDAQSGLFPAPAEIRFGCSCPDGAAMCKHIAAVLYGVGARLDTQPALLFQLRGVDHLELIASATSAIVQGAAAPAAPAMEADEMSDVFGIEISASPHRPEPASAEKPRPDETRESSPSLPTAASAPSPARPSPAVTRPPPGLKVRSGHPTRAPTAGSAAAGQQGAKPSSAGPRSKVATGNRRDAVGAKSSNSSRREKPPAVPTRLAPPSRRRPKGETPASPG